MTSHPMDPSALQACLAGRYGLAVQRLEPFRDSGNATYIVHTCQQRYFLRVTKPAFHDTALSALEVQIFLQERCFPVPRLIFALDGEPYIPLRADDGEYLLALYELLEGTSLDPGQETERVGAMLGQLHTHMANYPGNLVTRGRHYFIDRFYDMLQAKRYPCIEAFTEIGEALWESVKDLPRGYAHGDAYPGNFHRTSEGQLYLLDLDTSCCGIPAYDLALFGNRSDYFQLQPDHARRTQQTFAGLLPAYRAFHPFPEGEEHALYRLIALSHFALQPTIVDIFGLDCIDEEFLDKQLLWHWQWQAQCEALHLW